MSYARGSLAVTAMGDSVYAIGGFNSKEALHIVEVMDVRNNKWRSLSSLSTERAYGEAAVIADQVCTDIVLMIIWRPKCILFVLGCRHTVVIIEPQSLFSLMTWRTSPG